MQAHFWPKLVNLEVFGVDTLQFAKPPSSVSNGAKK